MDILSEMKAFSLFGLASLLLIILLVGPIVRGYSEGFSEKLPTITPNEMKNKVIKLGEQIIQFNKFLEDPTIDSSTKEKIVQEKEKLQKEVQTLSGAPLPSADVVPVKQKQEGFTGMGKTLAETAAQVSFE